MGPERGSEARCLEVKTDFGRLTRITPTCIHVGNTTVISFTKVLLSPFARINRFKPRKKEVLRVMTRK